MAPLSDNSSPEAPLFSAIPLREHHEQHSAAALKVSSDGRMALGRILGKRLWKKHLLGGGDTSRIYSE